jgi:hypothetical protein
VWAGKTGGANRFSLTFFSPFLCQDKKGEKSCLGLGFREDKKVEKTPGHME